MIYILDDRHDRQKNLLPPKFSSANFKFFNEQEISIFRTQMNEGNLDIPENAKIVCAHYSSLFESEILRDKFQEAVSAPLIFFSGGNSSSRKIKENLYLTSAQILYKRIALFDKEGTSKGDVNYFLFGKMYHAQLIASSLKIVSNLQVNGKSSLERIKDDLFSDIEDEIPELYQKVENCKDFDEVTQTLTKALIEL